MRLKIVLISSLFAFLLSGCGVGTLIALPFKVTGEVVNVVTPEVVGDSISGIGEVVDTAIPF